MLHQQLGSYGDSLSLLPVKEDLRGTPLVSNLDSFLTCNSSQVLGGIWAYIGEELEKTSKGL